MSSMKNRSRHFFVLAPIVALSLAGCGGGGAAGALTSVTTKVLDGVVSNALVCLDLNGNGQCDVGEPQSRTNRAGEATINATPDQIASAKMIASVGTDAVDADTGPVQSAYTLKATAGHPEMISPLTTMVRAKMEKNNVSESAAVSLVQSQLGIAVSPYDDYVSKRNSSADHQKAGNAARLLALSMQNSGSTTSASAAATACPSTRRKTETEVEYEYSDRLESIKSSIEDHQLSVNCSTGPSKMSCDAMLQSAALTPSCASTSSTGTTTGTTTSTGTTTGSGTTTSTGTTTGSGTTSSTGTTTSSGTTTSTGTTTGSGTTTSTGTTTGAGTTAGAASASGANGKLLYAAYCAMCHTANPATNTNSVLRGAGAPAVILNAINSNIGGMRFLNGTIGTAQANDLAAYLAAPGSY